MSLTSSTEEEKIYEIISNSLEALCMEKPNDPIYFLSKKMLEFIGEDIEKLGLSIYTRINNKDKILLTTLEKLSVKTFNDTYKVVKLLNNGISGSVYLCELRSDSSYLFAVKIVEKDNLISINETEKNKLCSIDHRNIVRLKDIVEENNFYYFIYEYCPYGNLLNYLSRKQSVSEKVLVDICRQLFLGLKYLHDNQIIHREIKPENILVYNIDSDESIQIKITDFGTSLYMKKKVNKNDYLSLIYTPPEAFQGIYTQKSDIWSIGVIMYLLFGGKLPFEDENNKTHLIYSIVNEKIKFLPSHSTKLRELLELVLEKDLLSRASISFILDEHPFFNDSLNNSIDDKNFKSNKNLKMIEVLNNISSFTVGKNLRQIVLSYICNNKLFKEKNFELSKLFEKADINHDGSLDAGEIYSVYHKYFPGTTEEQKEKLKKFIENVDINKNGKIDYSEFMLITSTFQDDNNKVILKQVFDFFDDNKNGFIEIKDLAKVLKSEKIDNERMQDMINEFDQNLDGKISFDEFYHIIEKYNSD